MTEIMDVSVSYSAHHWILQQERRNVLGGGQSGVPENYLQMANLWISIF